MAKEIDVRGLSCPQPVFLTKQAIDAGETEIVVTANDMVARENVKRLAENSGYSVSIEEIDEDFVLSIARKTG
jgi:TusA-related sulfurtransferase